MKKFCPRAFKDVRGHYVYLLLKYVRNYCILIEGTATVTGKGGYTGSKSASFIIKPAKVTAKKLTSPKAKTIKFTWTKAKGGVTGYQVQVALNKKFTKGKASYNVKASAAGKTIKGLKSKKTYFARVRAYKTVGKTRYYCAWSAVKSVKCR